MYINLWGFIIYYWAFEIILIVSFLWQISNQLSRSEKHEESRRKTNKFAIFCCYLMGTSIHVLPENFLILKPNCIELPDRLLIALV